MSHFYPKIPPEIVLLAAVLCGSATLLHGSTISLFANSDRPLEAGVSSCSLSGLGPIACDIHPTFSDPTGRNDAHADVSASAGSASVSAGAFVFSVNTNISALYQASFTGSVTVTGGSGTGTLITHWHLISTNSQFRLPGLAVSPSYFLMQDGAALSFTPNLPTAPPDPDHGGMEVDDLDVSSTFQFGTPLGLGAQTQAQLGQFQFATGNLSVSSSAAITGYTVLDASGAVVPGALVLSNAVPEPGTWAGTLAGSILLLAVIRKKLPRRSRAR